jgi:prolyl oligopeptidase
LEAGGVYAMANMRGGSEYGETWHQAGMLDKKQNVFDDFIAAAEWLIGNGYTRPERLAIRGGSNGGLLVAACMLQRPELYGAVVCQVPVIDMLRYHKFTVGRYWVPEYGNAENSRAEFDFLRAYSPLHNVRDGTEYPPILITSADTDDRVVPSHAKKFAATLQEKAAGINPILLRVETKAGHGGGKPTAKRIEEQADVYAFLFRTLGMEADH